MTKDCSPCKDNSAPPRSLAEMRALATELLYTGREHLNLGNFHSAASDLAESCENFAKVFGEASEECAECYLYYGRALLEVGRMESEVLGHALTGVDIEIEDCDDSNSQVEDPKEMNDEEKAEVEKCVDEAIKSHFNMVEKISVVHQETYLDSDDDSTETMDTDSPYKVSPNKASPSKDEDPSNLAHAWEMLALAELIYTVKAKKAEGEKRKEMEARVSDAVLWMGEVAMERENYQQAAAVFAECLVTRRGRYPEDSRSIAESHYCLGTAQAHQGSYAEAETNLNCAVAVLEKRIIKLENLGTSDFVAEEIWDLTEVIGDIKAKIVDHKNMAFAEVEVLKRKNSNCSPVGKSKAAKLDTAVAEGRIKSAKTVTATGTPVA